MKNSAATPISRVRRLSSLRRRLLPILIAGCFGQALANPQGAQVVAGQASFNSQGGLLSVINTPGAIINWQNFSINPGETTRFIQQSASSAVLNRVIGQDPSQILGALQSNGRVFLVNPNGILFGQGAQVDVNGLIASTLNISNEDFLNGKLNFMTVGGAGNISNQGTITTPAGGQVYLIAPNIENSGIIHSPRGDVLLAAGHTVQLVDSSDPNLQVVLSAPEHEALNIGQILTEGGKTGIYGALIRQRGVVSADSAVVGENGKIVFKASKEALLQAGSVTSAAGAGKGGEIQVLGERVGLMDNAVVDASGQAGGGTVLIGGDYKGENVAVQNAKRTYVSADARIRADAGVNGDGGKVIVWGDEIARVHGHISVRGGSQSGNGGFVETSGSYLNVNDIAVDASAPQGKAGTWLLDPLDITVQVGGANVLDDLLGFEDHASDATFIDASLINNATATVQLSAKRDIYIDEAIDIGNAGVGLTAAAGNNIHVNSDIVTNGSAVRLQANYEGHATGTGSIAVNALINSNGGDVQLEGANVNIGSIGAVEFGAGNLLVKANQANGTISLALPSHISGTGGGEVRFIADDIYLQGLLDAGNASAGKSVYISPYSTGRAIDLGTDMAGKLALTAAELTNIRAHDLTFNNASGIGSSIYVSAPLGFSATKLKKLSLYAGTGVTIDAGISLAADYGSIVLSSMGGSGIRIGSTGSVSASGAGAAVQLSATKLALGGSVSTTGAGGSVKISAPNAVELGSSDTGDTAVDTIQLGNGELNAIYTQNLKIHAEGGIHFSGAVAPTHIGNAITLYSDEGITQSAGAVISAPALAMSAKYVDLREANQTGVIAAEVQQDFAYRSANQLTITEIGDISGIIRPGSRAMYGMTSAGSDTPGTVFLQSDSAYGINQSMNAGIRTGGATLVLKTPGMVQLDSDYNSISKLAAVTAGELRVFSNSGMEVASSAIGINGISTNGGDVELHTGANAQLTVSQRIDAGTASVDLIADRLALNADVIAAEASIRPSSEGYAITVGQKGCMVEPCLSVTNLYRVAAGTIGIGRDPTELDYGFEPGPIYGPAVGPIHVAGITNSGSGALTDRNSVTTRIGLLSHGAITQSGAIDVREFGALGGGNVTLDNARNSVSTLVGSSEAGNFNFVNNGPLTIGSLVGDDYAVRGIKAPSGNISVSNTGQLVVASDAFVGTTTGDISLVAHSPLTVDGKLASTSGKITLEAGASGLATDVLTVNGTVATGGAVDLKAGAGIVINGTVQGGTVTQAPNQNQNQILDQGRSQIVSDAVNNVANAVTQAAAAIVASSADKANSGSRDEGKVEKTGSEQNDSSGKDDGAKKNESAKKLYCN